MTEVDQSHMSLPDSPISNLMKHFSITWHRSQPGAHGARYPNLCAVVKYSTNYFTSNPGHSRYMQVISVSNTIVCISKITLCTPGTSRLKTIQACSPGIARKITRAQQPVTSVPKVQGTRVPISWNGRPPDHPSHDKPYQFTNIDGIHNPRHRTYYL